MTQDPLLSSASTKHTKTDGNENELLLPPAPSMLKMLKYLFFALPTHGVEDVIGRLVVTCGSVVRLEMKFPKSLIRLFETWTHIHLHPYVLLSGPDANKLTSMSSPELVQRSPIVPKAFPAVDDTLQPQPSIASIDGEHQIQQHKLVMQAFKQKNLAGYLPVMGEIIERHITSWHGRIDIFDEMTHLTLEILARTMLGVEPTSPWYQEFVSCYWPIVIKKDRTSLFQSKDKMWNLLRNIVNERRLRPGDDALSTLIIASDAKTGATINEDDLLNYAYMLMEFGHSDSAITLTYLTAIVAVRHDLRRRLLEEHVHFSSEAVLAFEQKLPLTTNIVREVERLYPPVTFVLRAAQADLACGGYLIPKDSIIVNLIQQTHLLSTLFTNPHEFNPDRFASPNFEHDTPYALMGFGGGYHSCVAKTFVRMQECIYIHTLLQMYHIRLIGKQKMPKINYRNTIQQPGRRLFIECEPRQSL